MSVLVEKLAEHGIDASNMDNEKVRKIAKALGIDLPRQVSIVPYTNKRGETNRFVSCDRFVIGKREDGKVKTTDGLFLRVEALDQAIEDLQAARKLLDDEK